ncbi:MAG: TonB-dependent receptor [Bacteroidaceae bacterium]|nr:TonB-dependent receptor [Bacteroidaceae bacterium]
MNQFRQRISLLICSLLITVATLAQHTVQGVVLLDDNEPAIGATIIEKGNPSNGTRTNIDGEFTLTVPQKNAHLSVSYIGFQSQDVAIGGKTHLTIVLVEDSKVIEEIVIVGFGTQKKINATGAVKTIDDASLKDRPTSNAVESLQGVVAGLNISSDAGGAPGSSKNINIRGVGNLGDGSNSSPLILIDGMEGDISTLNPDDIENVSVLKDAASASIYGSRAPFGVILITTKNGSGAQKRPLSINYAGNVRFQQPVSVPNMVDGLTYAYMLNDAYQNSGEKAPFTTDHLGKISDFVTGKSNLSMGYYENLDTWYKNQAGYGNTNWYDVYVKDYTVSNEHNLSVSGSTNTIDYRVSGNYMSQTGLFNYADELYQRFNIAGKINARINQYLTLGWSTRFAADDNEKPSVMDDLFFHNLGRTSPVIPLVNPYNGEYHEDSMMQPILEGGRIDSKTNKLYNQLNVIIEPIKNWKLHAEINSRLERNPYTRSFNPMTYHMPSGKEEYLTAFRDITANEHNINASTGVFSVSPAAGETYREKATAKVNYFETNLYTDYNWKLDSGHEFTFLLGEQSEYYKIETDRYADYNYPTKTEGTVDKHIESNIQGEWSSLGIFGRVNYNYKYRYLAEVNVRADGASRFPTDQRWGYFPSVSLGWNITEEPFMEKIKDSFMDNLKLRVSYGTLGNQNTTSFYPYYQAMYVNTTSLVLGGQQQSSLPVYSPYSTSLTWETIVNKGVGVDFTLFGNRLTGSFDWFERTTKDMIGPAKSLPALYGEAAPKTNNAELRTRGWEVEVTWRDHIGKFNYSITANLSDYNTVVTKYYSPTGQCFGNSEVMRNGNYWYEGKDYGEIWGYRVIGIAQSDDEMNAYLDKVSQSAIGSKWGGGDLMYADINGDGKIDAGSATLTDHGDMVRIGNSTPRYAYSFTLQGDYKWFDFRIYMQGIGKRDFLFENCAPFYGIAGEWQRNLYTDHLDYYRFAGSDLGANFDAYYGRIRIDRNNIQASDRFLQNAAYLRLKNVQLGFTLPKGTVLDKYVKSARLYVSGENLLTFTKLRIFDPEGIDNGGGYGAGKVYPNYRTFSVGLNATF